jgi:hypothetical protein
MDDLTWDHIKEFQARLDATLLTMPADADDRAALDSLRVALSAYKAARSKAQRKK